jgi:hypothetical protein
VPRRAADRVRVKIDIELALADAVRHDHAFGHRGEHLHLPLSQLGADRPVAMGHITKSPPWPALRRLGIDQMLGLRTILLAGRTTCTAKIKGSQPFVAAAESLSPSKRDGCSGGRGASPDPRSR